MKKLFLGVMLAGFGTFAMAQQTPAQKKWTMEQKKEMMQAKKAQRMAEMQKDLNLTQAQTTQLQALHDRYQTKREAERTQNQQLREQKMAAAKKDRQMMDDEMRKILTPEQYQKWQANKMAKMQDKKHKARNFNKVK